MEFGQISCRDCIRGHLDMYQQREGVQLTVLGKDLLGHATFKKDGREWRAKLPRAATPVCDECEKPELTDENAEVVAVYLRISHQQVFAGMDGTRMGLRYEAAVAAIDWGVRAGQISDPDLVMERIWILDQTVNKIINDRTAARRDAEHPKASNPP